MDEKNRKLSKTEKKRLENFEIKKAALEEEGFKSYELTVGIVKANVFAILMGIPISVIMVVLFFLVNKDNIRFDIEITGPFIFLVVYFILVVVHELIHGITWAIFSKNHFKDIEFGFMKEYLTPYCACLEPMGKKHYLIGGLMPLIVLGIIPSVIAICINSLGLLLMGALMIFSAGGDIMISGKIMSYKSQAKNIIYFDHPTQAGLYVFEK